MTPSELRKIGQKLYGKHWQTKLARAIPVNVRTVRRWLAGKTKPHEAIACRIRGFLKDESSGKADTTQTQGGGE